MKTTAYVGILFTARVILQKLRAGVGWRGHLCREVGHVQPQVC